MNHLIKILPLLIVLILVNLVHAQDGVKLEQKKLKRLHEYSLKTLRAFDSGTNAKLVSHFKHMRDLSANGINWLKLPPTKRQGIKSSLYSEIDKFIGFQNDPMISGIANFPCIKDCMMICKEPSGKPDYLCRMDCYANCPPW